MQNNSYIAVLGDLHGHFTLALKILNRWERENNKKLDLILQVGDFGDSFEIGRGTKIF